MYKNLSPDLVRVPLVILPGLMCDSRMFPGISEQFHGTTFVDGFYPGAASIKAMADLALPQMPERFALLGHSMGARVAIEIWRQAPNRVDRLALVDTGTHAILLGEREKRYALRNLGREFGIEHLVREWLPAMLAVKNLGNRVLMATLEAMACSAGQQTFERQIEALLSRPDADAVLPTINCPTFVIVGEADIWSPVEQHRFLANSIPRAQLRIIPEAGHMVPIEEPEGFCQTVAEWLDWQPQATP